MEPVWIKLFDKRQQNLKDELHDGKPAASVLIKDFICLSACQFVGTWENLWKIIWHALEKEGYTC